MLSCRLMWLYRFGIRRLWCDTLKSVAKWVSRDHNRNVASDAAKELIMNNFQIFRLNFSWDVLKMYYFRNKFPKIAKHWGWRAPASFNLRFWWPQVTCFGLIVVFQTDYDEIELQKISYDVISVTLSQLCHLKRYQNNVTNFSVLAPLPIKISGYASSGQTYSASRRMLNKNGFN